MDKCRGGLPRHPPPLTPAAAVTSLEVSSLYKLSIDKQEDRSGPFKWKSGKCR